MTQLERDHLWPALPFPEWKETCATLHLWTQIVGKVRLALTPWLNHSWHVTLYVTARGLTTSPIAHHANLFEIDFDFIDHMLVIRSSTAAQRTIALRPMTVAAPNEVEDATPFSQDTKHASYDREHANRFWRVLLQSDRVFKDFRAPFIGK